MRKGIKILGKVFSAAVLLLIIVPVALSLLLDIPAVQNYAVHRAARFVSRKLETTVSIDRVDIGIFSKVRVKGFYVEDYQRDTLLYVGKLDAFITSFGIFGGGLELSRGEIADARLYLRQTPGGEMNIKQIVDRISDPDKPKKGNFRLSLKKASIENMDLCLERLDHRDPEHGIDFSHMHLYGITARVDDFTIDGQAIYTSIAAFSARERSGFVLNHLAGRFYMTQGCLGFENASIITPRSNVNFPFVSLAGDSWAQYKDFIGEVRIDASMRNTTVSTDDIAFFAPKLRDWHVDFTDVNVEVAGVVSDFTGRIRSMQIGEGTTLVADASVKGLPDIRKTRFDLSVPRLRSTARAVDELALGIAGRKLSDKLVGVLGNSGQIDLNARFRGLLSSFDMQLGAATGVGNVSCNLKMAPVKGGLSSVRGDVETRNLRLGELLDRRDLLGNATLTAYVDGVIGRGVADANVVGNVTQLGFNGYVYDSLRLDGRLRNREFDGRITARDPNLDFDFFGTVDLNDSVPRYDFTMDLRHADLARLHVNRRDSVSQLSGRIVAAAGGRSLDDLNGRIQVTDARYRYNDKEIAAASMTVTGENSERSKFVELRSDFADVTFRSKTSYRTVFEYLRRSAWKYLPMLGGEKWEETPSERKAAVANDFSLLSVNIRNFNPVADAGTSDRRRLVAATVVQSGQRPVVAQGSVGIHRAPAHACHAPFGQRLEPRRLAGGLRLGRGSLCRGAAPSAPLADGRRAAEPRAALGRLRRHPAPRLGARRVPRRGGRRARTQRPRRRFADSSLAHHPRRQDVADFRPQNPARHRAGRDRQVLRDEPRAGAAARRRRLAQPRGFGDALAA